MRVEGRRAFAANSETLWSLLHDPHTLQAILPGCESLEAVAPDEYRLTLDTRLGQAVERLIGTLRLNRVTPYQGFDFTAESGNQSGSLSARGRVTLAPEGRGLTALVYEADIEAGGRFAQITPRLMQTTMNAIARRSLDALEKQVALRTRVFTTTTTPQPDDRAALATTAVDRLAAYRRFLIIGPVLLAVLFIIRAIDRRRTSSVARQVVEMLERTPGRPSDPSPYGSLAAPDLKRP